MIRLVRIIICINLLLLVLTGCSDRYPRIEYIPTMWRADTINIKLEDAYVLQAYESIKTDDGYDLVFSFVEDNNNG